MTKEELEKLRSTVKEWLFHTGSLNPNNYADELCKDFIEPREKRIAALEAQIEKMKRDVFECFGSEYNMLVAKLFTEWEIKEK